MNVLPQSNYVYGRATLVPFVPEPRSFSAMIDQEVCGMIGELCQKHGLEKPPAATIYQMQKDFRGLFDKKR